MTLIPVYFPEGINPPGDGDGGGGGDPSVSTVYIIPTPFAAPVLSPTALYETVAGEWVVECRLHIITPFDGTVTFTVGEPGGTSRLMAADDSDPSEAGVYVSLPLYQYPAVATINLYTSASGNTTGAGVIFIHTRKG